MSQLSKTEKILRLLRENIGKKFTAREIVETLISLYPNDYIEKRKLYKDEKTFIQQLIAENGYSHLKPIHHLIKCEKDTNLKLKVYWYDNSQKNTSANIDDLKDKSIIENGLKNKEIDLYPILINYLHQDWKLYCLRIDEKKSSSVNGKNANKWLHPDIVAMKAIDHDWDSLVKECMESSSSQNVELYSFEVKKELSLSNIRESFFQAVSNSSWANEGYLVAENIKDDTYEELRVLSALHGIGVILLNANQPKESRIIFSAKHKINVDWQSVNRIVSVNKDFKKYIQLVHSYYKTGYIIKDNWNK